MKPIDTKTWKEFKIGDLFDVNQVNRLTFPGKSYVKDSEIISKDGTTPYIVATSTNNGIKGYSSYPANNEGDCITMSTTADSSATVFYQPNPFIGRQQMAGLYRKDKKPMGLYLGQFFVSGIKKVLTNYNYTNKLTITALKQNYLILPIQTTIDPDKTYHPEGYVPDWDYMEAFMEQINQQAQARLDEYKDGKVEYTPVDTKSWQEFKIGDLFKKVDLKRKKVDFQKNSDLSKTKTDEFNLPLVNAKHGNNGIMYYGREEDWEYAEMTIDIVSDGAVSAGNVYPQPNKTGILYNAYLIKPLKKDVTENHLSFLATVIEKYVKQKYSYANKCVWKKLALDKIPLPVDKTGQPDWNYMEAFMKQINQQAQAKLEQLEKGSI